MYLEFFGLTKLPFQLTSDPSFFYSTGGYAHIKARLDSCFLSRTGLAVVTGEPGIGKTLLIRQLISELSESIVLARF